MSAELVPIPRPHFLPTLPSVESVDLVAAFLAGRRPTTLRAYDRDPADFARFLVQRQLSSWPRSIECE